jgi:hypothetical protein
VRHVIAALLFAIGASGAGAQVIYKSTMPDGKVVYGEKPAPGARKVDKLEPPPAKSGITAVTPGEKAREDQLAKQRPAVAAQQRAVDDARAQLQKAEAAREAGKEPLPGERIGTAGGGSRLTDAYYARQKSLEEAVAAARKKVDETRK